jgi:hypothetical protein
MTFEEVLTQGRELLQRKGRVSYRALKLQFDLNDDYLAGLIAGFRWMRSQVSYAV